MPRKTGLNFPWRKKSPGETEADIVVSGMAWQLARFGKKLMRADHDLERYRARMNALQDVDAVNRGVDPSDLVMGKEEDVKVFTNSPVTTTTSKTIETPAWIMAIVGAATIAGGLWMGHFFFAPDPVPDPDPPPVTTPGDLHIKVIRPEK